MTFSSNERFDSAPNGSAEERPVNERKALSVSAALNIAKSIISENAFHIVGEVSELNQKPGYKAVYFTIKDENSALPCLMWMNRYKSAGVPLRLGARVEVVGKFTIFTPKGRMNFDVSSLKLAGEGDLRAQVAKRALMLKNEGLMDPARKRSVVAYPSTIGLVTSPRGAAVHDVLRTLRRRYPLAKILFAGVPVEGKQAAADLISGLETVIRAGAEEVLLVRGGGSFEDLMPFNDETLARFIAQSPVPIITGIGHEPDTSIADMVADVRASTPTAAAEAVSPSRFELLEALDSFGARMSQVFLHRIERSINYVNAFENRPLFRDMHYLYANDLQWLDHTQARLESALGRFGEADKAKLEGVGSRLTSALPHMIASQLQSLDHLARTFATSLDAQFTARNHDLSLYDLAMANTGKTVLERFFNQAALASARLNDLSPLGALARGWSITKDASGALVKSIEGVKPNDRLSIQVSDGVIDCAVAATHEEVIIEFGETN